MAPSRPPPVDEPPSASSSEEEESDDETMLNQKPTKDLSEDDEEEVEEEEEEVEEETDDDEEEIPQTVVNKHNDKKPIPTQSSLPVESEEDEEEEGTESDDFDMQAVPSPSISNFTIKPNTTTSNKQPVDYSSPKSKKSSGKADPSPTTSTTITLARSSTKRALESSSKENGSPKKRRGITSNGAEEKSGTNRLWSENDQIAILKGMIDYQSNNGSDPLTDAAAFHDMMKKSLNVDVSRGQMVDKIRRMRKKYLNNAEKGENGQDPVFAKPYESQSFELSKRIWGVNKVSNGSSSSRKRKVKKVEVENPQTSSQENGIMDVEMKEEEVTKEKEVKEEEESDEDFWKKYPLLERSLSNCVESPVVRGEDWKKALRSMGNSNAKVLEDNWRKFRVEELELHIKKMDLIYQQTKMIQQTFNQTNG
ncbi:STOREKEEPER protein-like [Impatiens glandulifera]|uniref:STOREKEEPER protein-like n=1 Tax=Impatiens glandulifera TaxID=253017 RepID=UPI001FB0E433|nr:STOREKEEPER protein-like [Impatiens glandulifera]